MKKVFWGLMALALLSPSLALATEIKDRMTFSGQVTTKGHSITMEEISSAATPATGYWQLYFTSDGLYVMDDAASATLITAGAGDNALDDAYDQGGAGAGRTITTDSGAVALTNTDADAAFQFTINASPSSAAASGGAQITIGANSTQDALEFANSGSGYDIYGTSGTWTMSKAGALSGVSADLSGALSADGVITLGDGTSTVAVNSSVWDVSTAGAMTGITSISGLSTLALSGDITFDNGNGIQSSTTTAETVLIQGYDVDNTTYRNAITVTNGNTIATAIGTGSETVAVNSTTWDVSTAGAFTGVADITGTAGEAMTVTIASDGAADDLTLSVTGATDSSVVLASAGTGDDAIKVAASAGGVDVDAVKSVTISSSEAQADAIAINASAGGVDITSAATYDIDITATGGTVQVVPSEAAANQFKVDAQGTVAGYAIVLETTDGGVQINADGAANGDILVDAGDDLGLTAAGDLTFSVTGTISAGGSAITNVLEDSETTAADNILTAAECGKVIFFDSATEFDNTLPALSTVSGGCYFDFIVIGAPSGDSYRVLTGNSLENGIYGLVVVNGASVAGASEDTITFADGAAVRGDWARVVSDGTSWYVRGQGSGAGAITLTQAD